MHAFHADINKRLSIVSAPSSMMGDAFHFVDGYDYYGEYSYDGCGALTGDMNKGIRQIKYDFNGLPTSVWFKDGSITEYVYTADGTKLKTIHRTAVEGTAATGGVPYLSEQNTLRKDSTLYVGAYELCSNSSDKYFFVNGYIGFERGRLDSYFYYAKDHLGNVRHVDRSTPERDNGIVQITNYYPFGGILNESFNRVDYQNKLYNGKEFDRMHGLDLYDYSARQYDPAIGQFTSMDPLCEKYYHISPYAYCAGNPVKYVDPDGREPHIWGGLIGGGTEIACQMFFEGKSFSELNWTKVGIATAEGALTCGASVGEKIAVKAVACVVNSIADNSAEGVMSVAGGAVMNATGELLGEGAAKALGSMAKTVVKNATDKTAIASTTSMTKKY